MKRSPLAAIARLLIMAVILGIHFEVARPRFGYDPPFLALMLNVFFLCLVSFFLARVSARGHLLSGNPILLCLGCGALTKKNFVLTLHVPYRARSVFRRTVARKPAEGQDFHGPLKNPTPFLN
jgi:hypothetical protein